MQKQKISEIEKELIFKDYKRTIWCDFFILSIELPSKFSPFLIIAILLNIYFSLVNIGLYTVLLIYITTFLFINFMNFLNKKMNVKKALKKDLILRIIECFKVEKKETSNSFSDIDFERYYYYRIYLLGERNQKKEISVTKEDYKKIKVGDEIVVTYFDVVNILYEASYKNEILINATF